MSDKISLIDTEALSGVAVKLLEMIEDGVGWVVTPKGGRKDFVDALEYYKKSILEDDAIPPLVKASRIATAKRDLIQYINQGKLIEKTIPLLQQDATLASLDLDWLSYFFSYAKNIQDETIQTIWANILAEECNGDTSIQRNLIHVLSLLDTTTAKAFMRLCRIVIKIPIEQINYTFESRYLPKFIPLITPFRWYSIFFVLPDDSVEKKIVMQYKSCLPSPEQLAIMKELGLINIREDTKAEFGYPYNFGLTHYNFNEKGRSSNEYVLTGVTRNDYLIQYYEDKFKVVPNREKYAQDPDEIKLGLVQLSSIGEMLYRMIAIEKIEGFDVFLEKFFQARGFVLEKVSPI